MDFLADLDEYFCEKFANYDLFCGLPQYRMPTMHVTTTDEYGRKNSYTLPKNTMRLAKQEKKAELLAIVKEKLVCRDFTFSFQTLKWFSRLKHRFSKMGFAKVAPLVAQHNGLTFEQLFEGTVVDDEVVQGMKKGRYLPTKNLLFAVALSAHLTLDDTEALMTVCDMEWDDTMQRDIVVKYLLQQRVFNADMVWAALDEYKVKYLYLKRTDA